MRSRYLQKGTFYVGPRGGKWADPQHTIPYREEESAKPQSHVVQVPKQINSMGTLEITAVRKGDQVEVSQKGGASVTMPAESLSHFVQDLSGKVSAPPRPATPAVNAVIEGKAQLLGKGDDGLAFRVGDSVVKVSTTVPFQPFNTGHRTPAQAKAMIKRQVETGNLLAAKGIPTLESRFVESGEKAFQIKPYVEIPEKLTPAQLSAATKGLRAMHAAGFAMNDTIQVGLHGGKVVFFDVGKAAPATVEAKRRDAERLEQLYREHGQKPPAFTGATMSGEKSYREAFELADKVADGKLPPVMAKIARKKYESAARQELEGLRGEALAQGEREMKERLAMIDDLIAEAPLRKSSKGWIRLLSFAALCKAKKPPGAGWQPIVGGKKGGFRRLRGGKWQYWYPDAQGSAPGKKPAKKPAKQPRQLGLFDTPPAKPSERPAPPTKEPEAPPKEAKPDLLAILEGRVQVDVPDEPDNALTAEERRSYEQTLQEYAALTGDDLTGTETDPDRVRAHARMLRQRIEAHKQAAAKKERTARARRQREEAKAREAAATDANLTMLEPGDIKEGRPRGVSNAATDFQRSLLALVKNNNGHWKSEKQAKFILSKLRQDTSAEAEAWAAKVGVQPPVYAGMTAAHVPGTGIRDKSRRRYAGFFLVVDSGGVAAVGKPKFTADGSFRHDRPVETVFRRTKEPTIRVDIEADARQREQQLAEQRKKLRPLADKLEAKIPPDDPNDLRQNNDILRDFVEQLRDGRPLSIKQTAILHNKGIYLEDSEHRKQSLAETGEQLQRVLSQGFDKLADRFIRAAGATPHEREQIKEIGDKLRAGTLSAADLRSGHYHAGQDVLRRLTYALATARGASTFEPVDLFEQLQKMSRAKKMTKRGARHVVMAQQLSRASDQQIASVVDATISEEEAASGPPPDPFEEFERARPRPAGPKLLIKADKLAGSMRFQGLDIAIEHRAGDKRKWRDPDGKEGEIVMRYPYGYLRGSKGADGEALDVYVGPDADSTKVFVINQRQIGDKRKFDEHKIMLGFSSKAQARKAYLQHYTPSALGRALIGSIRTWTLDRLRQFLDEHDHAKRPLGKSLHDPATNPRVQHVIRVANCGYVGSPNRPEMSPAVQRARVLGCFYDRHSAESFARALCRPEVYALPESAVDPRDRVAFERIDSVEPWYVLDPKILRLVVPG